MTNATMALAELAEKGPDVDMLRQMVQFAAQRLMDMEAAQVRHLSGVLTIREAHEAVG